MMNFRMMAVGLVALTAPMAAQAQEAAAPAATSDAPALCTDRPTKSNSVCTVPQGAFQLETDLPNWTVNRADGVRSDVVVPANPYLKYGLAPNTDIEVNWAPYVSVRTRAGDSVDRSSGVGDVTVRLKQRFTDPAAKLQVGVIPFVKIPTAKRGIGNREWEGGVAVPVQYSLPAGFSLTFGPELDVLANSVDPAKRHVQLVGTVNVGKALTPTLTLYGELWTAQNYDPAGTVRQYSADVALAWLVAPRLQLDAGANFGLNKVTPDAQLYLGLSTRF